MLFKPWSEFERTPRHTIDELDDGNIAESSSLYKFSLEGKFSEISKYERSPLIVFTNQLRFVYNCLDNSSLFATVNAVASASSSSATANNPQYIEDQQLYASHSIEESFNSFSVEIRHLNGFNIICLPSFIGLNPMAINEFSRFLLSEALLPEHICIISPCSLNYSELICKLISHPQDSLLEKITVSVPFLKPPHFVSGAGASLMSFASSQNIHTVLLLLDSEGAAGFERIASGPINEAIDLVCSLLNIKSSHIKDLANSKVGNIQSSGSGMYI